MALQEVLTRFGFDFHAGKLAAVERGVKRASVNLNSVAHNADLFQQRMGGFISRAKGLIGAYLGFRAVRAITTDYATAADSVAKFSAALNLNTETYQGLQHAVQIGGSDTETLNKALAQLQKRSLEASQGLTTNVRAFKDAGVEWESAPGKLKGAEQLFIELADGLNNLDDSEKAAGLSMQLLGRTGISLRNTMKGGAKGIQELIVEAKTLGKVLSKEQLKAAEEFNDEMLRAKSVMQGVRNQIAAKLLPAITRQLKAFQMWARRGDNLKVALERLRIVAKALGVILAMVVTVKMIRAIKFYAGAMQAAVRWVVALGHAASFAQIKTMLLYGALLLIPLLIQDLVFFAQGKDSLIGRILGDSKLAKTMKAALLDIGKALKAAWKDLKPALVEAWKAMKPALKELWKAIKPIIGPAFKVAIWVLVAAFQMLAITIRIVAFAVRQFVKTAKLIKNAWADALDVMKSGFDKFTSSVDKQAKKIGIDFGKMAGSASRGFKRFMAGHKTFWDRVEGTAARALRLMGLLAPKEEIKLGKMVAAQKKRIATIEAHAAPLLPGLLRPQGPETIFSPIPGLVPALPGGIGGLPGIGSAVGAVHNVMSVEPGAIVVNVKAEGDPVAIGQQVNAAVKAALSTTITDASRDLVKPPRGQR